MIDKVKEAISKFHDLHLDPEHIDQFINTIFKEAQNGRDSIDMTLMLEDSCKKDAEVLRIVSFLLIQRLMYDFVTQSTEEDKIQVINVDQDGNIDQDGNVH